MPKFRVHMESPDLMRDDGTPHVRITTGMFADKGAAREHCERQEMRIAAHEYPAAALAELEVIEAAALEAAEVQGDAMRDVAGQAAREAAESAGFSSGEVAAAQKAAEEAVVAPVGRAPAQVRMQLATHRQTKPYAVVSVEEVN